MAAIGDSKAWSSPRSSAVDMVEGMSTALAASAKWAKTPNLLGDIIGCIQVNREVERQRDVVEAKAARRMKQRKAEPQFVHYDCCRVIYHVNRRTLKSRCQCVARVKHTPIQAKRPVKYISRQSIIPASVCTSRRIARCVGDFLSA
jgi:hypothetical protein